MTFPLTPKRRSSVGAALLTGTYRVCLDCGAELGYDWQEMRVIHKAEIKKNRARTNGSGPPPHGTPRPRTRDNSIGAHRHDWNALAVIHGVLGKDFPATQILQVCRNDGCGRYRTQTVLGCWDLEAVRMGLPGENAAPLPRSMRLQ